MTDYPLIIRNRIPLFYRGFMLVFVAGVGVGTYLAIRDAPADGGEWWSIPIAAFWLAGIGGLVWAMNQEIGVLRVAGRGDVHITRGRAFRRVEHRTGTVRLSIEDTKDSEGDPYFKLWIEAPGGPLVVAEGHFREGLEALRQKIETAVSGQPYSGSNKLASP